MDILGAGTRFILSTSGRSSSLQRYRALLQEILKFDIAYIPISSSAGPKAPIDPERFCMALRGMNCIGGAISRNIKTSVVPYLDAVSPDAKGIGVNTVIRKGDKLIGYNTDAIGFMKAIQRGVAEANVAVKRAIVYGYGGVTNVVVSVLKDKLGYEVYLTGRSFEKAKARASQLGVKSINIVGKAPDTSTLDGLSFDLLVNAAPVTDNELSKASGLLETLAMGVKVCFDHEMPGAKLKQYCAKNSIHHISGYDMYYPQMYKQWAYFLEGLVEEETIPELIKSAETVMKSSL
mmetsp:Transcript_22345/g.35891  ORF Transcript_22345/g.35891 Transcript_22345/m.35891 type:complete len:291 (+) Transcript_22345:214-1086(+)